MKNIIPNNWNLQEVMALTYIKGMYFKECEKVINKYPTYNDFKKNAFNVRQGDFFNTNDAKEVSNLEIAEKQIHLAEKLGFSIITIWDNYYPALLKQTDYPPTILYVWGKLQNSDAMAIAVVGTRQNTNYGKLATEHFVSEFVKQNIVITSGLANGIDTFAHKTAIQNQGITYAVIASGLDKIVSKTQYQLADEIVNAQGTIISEYKLGTSALQGYFLQRNRIISGISKATLVVESAYKGGALNTANFADLYSRDVFVVPGNIFSEKSAGTNNLIHKNKAIIAISPQTLLNDIGINQLNYSQPKIEDTLYSSKTEENICNSLSHEPIHIDALAMMFNIDISELLVLLLDMEFKGLVKGHPGKYYTKGL